MDFTTWLKNYKRSSKDNVLGGVCGGLGEATDIPSWVWRVLFVLVAFGTGIGAIPYILIWIFAPID